MRKIRPAQSPPIALTMGEPGGVGAEITAKAWQALRGTGPVFFLIDDPVRLRALNIPVAQIDTAADAKRAFPDALPVLPIGAAVNAKLGVSSGVNAPHVITSIKRAVALCLDGAASGMVTNPIQKSTLIDCGFRFAGHTEFLEDLTSGTTVPGRRPGCVMMLVSPQLRVVPVTIHLPLGSAIVALDTDQIVETALVTSDALRFDFGIDDPRLAISGLNPHAGEAGALGSEDVEIIAPAIELLRKAGVDVTGPLSADTMFHAEARAQYDAAICMYHDQALIPIKTLAFHAAVNVTLGLPIIRTSPDHGTALDIAGKGLARADSLIAAITLADDMAARRQRK